MNTKPMKYFLLALSVCYGFVLALSSCSDEPDSSNFYTFKGQMMSEYLYGHEQFSEFTAILERAGMMELLAAYGAYTCFPPTNEAVRNYLAKRGLSSVSELSVADCDTLARTHLVKNMYTTADMDDGVLSTANMNRRYIEVSHGVDEEQNAVVYLNGTSHIIFALQDDSVENGIMQPITEVLESSNRMILDVMKQNPNISLYVDAYEQTGLADSFYQYKDPTWDPTAYEQHWKYISHVNRETASPPDEKRYGYTLFVPTDSLLREKYGITTVRGLYDKACEIYDAVYPEDKDAEYHDFAHIKHPKNPLFRFLAYHVLTRDVKGWNYLTPYKDVGILTTVMNPVDWYETMLPHTMMKFERLTVRKWAGPSVIGQRYINRLITLNDLYINSSIKGLKMIPKRSIPSDMSLDDFARQAMEVGGWIVYEPDPTGARPEVINQSAMNLGVSEMLQLQLSSINEITSVNSSLQGVPPKGNTGYARYAMEMENSSTSVAALTHKFTEFERKLARKKMKVIHQFYQQPRDVATARTTEYGRFITYEPQAVADIDFKVSIQDNADSPVARMMTNDLVMQLWQNGAISADQLLQNLYIPGSKIQL